MKLSVLAAVSALGLLAWAPSASAVTCANGVYRAGCAGPNGAVGVRKGGAYYGHGGYYHRPAYPPAGYYHRPYYPPHPPVAAGCASGPYRAGCAGPHGAVVVRRPY